jgi:predicted HNH restriction endonuclease
MSERISEILEVLRYVADHYMPEMSEKDVKDLRIEALGRVAHRRSILPTTVSNKFRRELRPAINGTSGFDRALFEWLDSRATKLQLALEQNATRSDDFARIREFFEDDSLLKQVVADLAALQEEESGTEGARKARLVSYFERNPALRTAAIEIHRTTCKACGFNFEANYGAHGKNYIEVHHVVPISTLPELSTIKPKDDLTVLCSNCHRMVHRKRDAPLSIEELAKMVSEKSSRNESHT